MTAANADAFLLINLLIDSRIGCRSEAAGTTFAAHLPHSAGGISSQAECRLPESTSELGADGRDRGCKHGRSRPVIAQDVDGRLNFSLTDQELSARAEEMEKNSVDSSRIPFMSGARLECAQIGQS